MVINILLLFLLAYTIERRTNTPTLYAWPISIYASSLFLFAMAQLGLLQFGKIIWICGTIFFFFITTRCKPNCGINSFSLQHLAIVVANVIIFLIFHDGKIMGCDPYFWGEFSKYIQTTNEFWSSTSNIVDSVQHRSYTPGFAIFATLYNGIFTYSESAQYISFVTPSITLFCICMQLTKDTASTTIRIGYAIFCFLLLKTLGVINPVNFLNADFSIAAFFSQALMIALYEKNTRVALAFLILALPMMSIIKVTGILLSCIVIVIFATKMILESKSKNITVFKNTIFLFISSISTPLWWKISLSQRGITDSSSRISLEKINIALERYLDNSLNISSDLIHTFFFEPSIYIFPKVLSPLTGTLPIVAISIYIFYRTQKKTNTPRTPYIIILLASFTAWTLLHLYIIATSLPDSFTTGIIGRTYQRYVGAFTCAILVTSISGAFLHANRRTLHSKFITWPCFLMIAAIPPYAACTYLRSHPEHHHIAIANKLNYAYLNEFFRIQRASQHIKDNTPEHSKIMGIFRYANACEDGHLGFTLRPLRHFEIFDTSKNAENTTDIQTIIKKNNIDFIYTENHDILNTLSIDTQHLDQKKALLIDVRPLNHGSSPIVIHKINSDIPSKCNDQ